MYYCSSKCRFITKKEQLLRYFSVFVDHCVLSTAILNIDLVRHIVLRKFEHSKKKDLRGSKTVQNSEAMEFRIPGL